MLFALGGPQPQIGGWLGCGVPFSISMLYVVNVVTMIVIGIDKGMHDNYHV
jgi:hypothetical protein